MRAHGRRRRQTSYGTQLREKQRIRRSYGLLEKQFYNFYKKAERAKGITGHNLVIMLDTRLDSVLLRAGLVATRAQARQYIRHGHVAVNEHKVDIPSFRVKAGDKVSIREKSSVAPQVKFRLERLQPQPVDWLEVDQKRLEIVINRLPNREDISMPFNEQLVVELYSR